MEIANEHMSTRSRNGIFIVLAKVLPKLFSIMTKVFKGVLSLKTVGIAASVGLYSYVWTWQFGLSLTLFILIHEYGHFFAMKHCGLKTKGVYLIPGFGGAAITEEGFKSSRNEVYIALMGPLAGLLFIVPAIGIYYATQNPMYAAIASFMAFINLFNLFPINPLDGGRVVKGLLFSFRSWIGLLFSLLSFFVAITLGAFTHLSLLVIIALLGLYESVEEYGLGEHLKKFKTTGLRFGASLLWIFMVFSNLTGLFGLIAHIFGTIIATCIVIGEMMYSCKKEETPIYFFPFMLIRDFILGFWEIFCLRPSFIKKPEGFESMANKQIMGYTIAYGATIALMVWLILFTSHIPGADLAKQLLQ